MDPRGDSEPSGFAHRFDNAMTKFIVNNKTAKLKTDFNLFFTITNCPLSFVYPSHKLLIDVSVRLLTMTISQWARESICSYHRRFLILEFFLKFGFEININKKFKKWKKCSQEILISNLYPPCSFEKPRR